MITVLGYLAKQRRWTVREAIEEYERTAVRMEELTARSVSERQWKRWCYGEGRPQLSACRVLEAMTGYPIGELLAEYTPDISTKRSSEPTLDVKGVMAMVTRRARDWLTTVEATNVGPDTLEDLREEVSALSRSYPKVPVPTLLPDLVDTQHIIFRLLEGKQPLSASRDLYLYAGMSSGLLGWAAADLSDTGAAFTQARLAHACGTIAGHSGMRAWARALQSGIAYWSNRPAEALRCARAGIAEAGDLVSTTAARLASVEARALARLGRPIETLRALERAESLRERAQPDELDELGGELTFTMPHQLSYRADTIGLVPGDRAEAELAAFDAVTANERVPEEEMSYGTLACSRASLALARTKRGDIDGAHEAIRPLLDLPPEQRVDGVTSMTQRVADETKRIDSPLAQTMREEIEEFARNCPPFRPR